MNIFTSIITNVNITIIIHRSNIKIGGSNINHAYIVHTHEYIMNITIITEVSSNNMSVSNVNQPCLRRPYLRPQRHVPPRACISMSTS